MYTGNEDFYQILGVSPEATGKEIKAQYKKLMAENHPDKFKGVKAKHEVTGDEVLLEILEEKIRQAEETCKFINEAYETLSDSAKRKAYDEEAYEPSVAAPEIVVSPTKISFGTLTEEQRKSKGFTIENKGGPATSVEINWEDEPDWGEIIIEPDPENTFPIKVTIVADTTGIPSGPKNQKVLVNVDGVTYEVEVALEVVLADKPKPAPAGVGATPPPPPAGTVVSHSTSRPRWLTVLIRGVLIYLLVAALFNGLGGLAIANGWRMPDVECIVSLVFGVLVLILFVPWLARR